MKINDRCIIITMHLCQSCFLPVLILSFSLSLIVLLYVCLSVCVHAYMNVCAPVHNRLLMQHLLVIFLYLNVYVYGVWFVYPSFCLNIQKCRGLLVVILKDALTAVHVTRCVQRCGRPNSGVHFPNSSRMLVHLFNSMSRVTMALL